MMDLEDPTRMEYEIVVPVKPLPSSDKPLKGLLKRNKCDSNSSSSSSSSSEKDGKAKRRVKFAETMMVFCDDWPQEVMPQIIALKSPTDFNLIEIVASGFMFDPPVEYQDLLPFDPPPDYQDCVSSNKHPSIIPMSSYEKDSSISFIDDDDQCESDEFVNDYHNQLNSSLHWENILNESEILEEDIIGVLKEDEILQAIGSQTADIDTVFHPMESEENFSETDFPVHYQNGQFIQQSQGFNSNVNSNGHSSSDEGYHVVDGYCDRINQATETSETYSEAEELSSDLASDSSFTSQDTIILTTPLASDPNSLCRNGFHPSSSSADSLLSPGKTVVTYVDQYSDYTQLDVNLEFESKLNKPVLETINDEEEEVRSEADIGSISEDRSSLNESTLEDVNKVNSDNYRSKSSNETSGKDDCTTSIEGDDGDDDIVSEADNSLNQGEGSCNINEVNTVIRKEDKEGDFNADDESNQSTGNNENYMSDIHGAIRNDSIGSKILNTNNNEPVNQLNEVSESMNTRPLARTGPVNECPEGSVKSVSLAKPLPAPSSLTSSPSSLNASSTTMSSSSSPIQSSIIGPTTVVSSSTFIPTQSASVVNTCGSNVVVIGLVDCEGINKSTNHPQQLLTAVPVNATSVSVSAIRKAFEVKHESEAPLYENTTEMRNKTKNTSQPAPARPKSFPFSNFKLGKSVESNKNNYNSVNNSTSTNSSSTSNINNNANVGNNSNQSGSSGSSLIKEATNVMTEKLKWLTLHGGGDSSKQLTNDESGKTAQPSTSSTTTINENKSKQSQQQQQQQQQQQHQQQPQPQRSKEDLIIEYTSEPRGAQQVKRVSLTEAALKAATCNNTKGVNTLPGNPSSAQIVSHYHHLHHHHGQGITSHQIVHPSHQQPHLHHQQQPLAIPVNHLQCFPPGTNIPASISTMGTAHQIVHHPAHPPASIQHLGPTPQQIQLVKSAPSVISSSASSPQFIIPSTPQQQSPNQIQSQPPPQSQQQANAPQYHIYPVTKCRAASPQFINQYYTTTTPGGQRQLVYVSHVAPGQQFMTSQTIHHHPHIHPHLHLQQHQQPQPQQSQTSGQTIHGQPTPIQPGTVTMVSGAPQGSRETPSPSIIQLHCRPGSAMSNSSIVGSRIYAQPLQHGFVAVPKDSSFPNPSEIRRRDGLNAYPIVKEDPLNVVNTSNGSTTNGSSPTASSLSSASSSSSSSISPSSSSTTSTVPNSTNSKSGNSSDSTNLTSSDTKDELEQFVENDIQRIERIKRRYSLTEEGDDPTFGFGRRPSVRGIKPKYGPSEIIRHMQMQLRPSVQSVAPQTLPKQAKVINTQIVNESTNLVSSASSHGLTTSLSTITTATPVILTSGSVSSQSSSSQVPRTAQIHLITRHSHSHSHCHPHLISASQVGSVPNLRQHLVSSTSSVSPSSSSTSSPSPSGHNTIGHRHVYLIPHVQGGPQYQRIVQAAGATLPRPHPGQQQGQSQHQPSTGLTQQLSAQQAAMLMMKQIGGRVKIINGSQSAGSIGIVGNQPPLSRPASSLGHIIQRGSGDAELRLTPQSSASSSSDVTCKQCPVRPAGSMEPQPGQPQSITIISNKVGPCLLQHKTISMPNVSLIKSLPQTLTVVPINDIKDERGAPEGASASPTHSSDKDFVESNKATKSVDANADTMSTGSTSSCSSSTSSANTGTPSSNNNLIVNNNNNNFNNTKNNNDVNNSTSNSNNPNNTNANNNNNNDNDDITEKNNNNNNTNNLTNSNNNVNTNNNINNNMNNNPDLVKDATTSALKAKKTIASDMKDGKSKPVSSKDGVIYYSMNV